ncbi:NADH-quinone oxidoreductase subunit B [Sulfurospirillum sp. 1612]|uniref:NADH-quinone oxidoreductase subunit B n=1 Tax=Sulfurospirillum sp. 1612 TaxID=3094835 RepID=UPI002F945A59
MEIGFHGHEFDKAERNTQTLIEKTINWFRSKSIFVVAYGTGCGAIEMPPTFTSRYDAERGGVVGVATPRQADVIIVSGYLAYKTLRRVIRTYEQMQSPKYVIGLGSCAINGGMYWDSYNTIKKLDDYIPVDMLVNGCMPRPEALLEGFAKLQERIRNGEQGGWEKYEKNLEFYKKNQKKVLGENIDPSYEADWYMLKQGATL